MQQRTPEEYKKAYERHRKAGNKDNAARVAQLYRQHLATQQPQVAPEDRDNAFQYSIDQAQKMYGGAVQNVGRIAGSPSIEQYGKQVSDEQDQDIAKGGYQGNYSSARDSYDKEGLSGVAKWATEGVAENAVSGGAALVGTAATALASVYGAPAWLVGTLGAATLANSVALGTGDNVLEQQEKTGDFDARVATGVGVISGILDRVGAGRAIPKDALGKMTTEEVIGELVSQGKVSAAKEFAKRIGAEAVTETAQEALNIGGTALVGGDYTAQEVKDRTLDSFLLGGAQAGAMNTGISTLSSATNLVKGNGKKSSGQTEREGQSQASFAQRLAAKVEDSQNADGPAYDLRDVDPDSRSGAKAVIDSVHTEMAAELKQLVNLLKSRLKPEKTDPLNVVLDKSEAAVAAVKAKNKVKNVVDASDFKAFENLVGDTAEGQLAINLMHELNQLTRVYSDGLTGGVSRYTDAMSPVGPLDNYSNTGGVMQQFARPLATVALATANPGLAAAQVGTFTAGRAIDKVTGKRSRVRTYVDKNQNNPAQPVPTQPSLRNAEIAEQQAAQEAEMAAQAAAEQRAAEEREANLDLVQRGAPPLLGSPEDIFRDGTGLDRSGLAQVIRILKANTNTKVATRRAIEAYETSIATGGRVDFTLIRNINSMVDQFPQLKQLQVRPRNQATVDQAIQQQYSQQQQNYERGIENNRQFATQLTDALNADKSVQPIHKALLLDSLGQMQLDLGANPVSRLQAMEDRLAEKGVPVEAVQQYFAPYIERVVAQQEAKQSLDNTEQAVDDDVDPVNDARVLPIPNTNSRLVDLATQGQAMFTGKQVDSKAFDMEQSGNLGAYIDLDTGENHTGKAFTSALVSVDRQSGRPSMETSDTESSLPNYGNRAKNAGRVYHTNLVQNKSPQSLWSWAEKPDGVDHEAVVVTTQGKFDDTSETHVYSLNYQAEVPVELYSKKFNPTKDKQADNPVLRPKTKGTAVLGNKVGSIYIKSSRKVHPVYDEVKVVDKRDQEDPVNDSKGITLAGKVKILREQYEENPNSKEARRAYLDARDERDASGDFGEEVTPDYRVQHQAPVSDDDTPMHLLDQVMPDFYTRPRYYKTGSKLDSKTIDILQQLKGKPEQIVKVYRAVPKDAPDTINYGDWVTVNKQYAEDHGEGMPEGYKIIEGAAPAKNIKTNGDSIHEFGYAQFDPGKTESDKIVDSRLPALTVSSSPNVISLMDGSETAPKLTGKTEVAKYLEGRAKDKLGRVLDIAEPSDRSSIADSMVLEAIHEMESQDEGSAMDWYDATIEKMLEMMALKYPEIATDDNAKTPMLIALSIMSQNMDVPTNLAIAEKAYEHFRENGRFSINGQGKSQKVMELNFKKANTLLEKLGSMARLEKFLATKFTVKTLNPILNEYLGDEGYVGGENVDTEVYGSSVFGPKVGNGFYTNLTGDFSPVTMDMWFMRTVGRLKGNLMEFEEAKFQKQLTRLKKALNRKRISREQLIEKAFDLVKKHEADYKKNRKLYDLPKGHAKRKVKSSATLAAYTIKNSLKNTIDSPASGTERNNLRLLVTEAVTKFNEKTGLDIEPAAFQALIWYPEQDLYKKLGVRLKNVRKDFATSLKELLIKEGYNEKDLNSAVARVQQRREQRTGQVRQGTAQADRSSTGQTSRPSGSSVRGSRETGPVLATEDPVNNSVEAAFARVQEEYLQPTPAEIKEKLPEAEDIVNFTIGKKGTAFEDGVRSEDDIRRIAALLDISISVLNTKEEASKSLSENTRGNYGNKMYGTAGHINIKGENLIGRPQYIATLVHEVGHGVEGQTLDRAISDGALEKSPHPRGSKAHNAVSYRHGSYREHMHFALKIAKGEEVYRTDLILPDYDEALEIRREIDHIQEALVALRFPGFAEGSLDTKGLVVRESVEKLIEDEAAETARRVINNGSSKSYEVIYENSKENMMREYGRPHIRYLKDTAEFAVDSVILYLTDPQLMKLIAPVTAAYMKKIFKKSGMPVKFYASPLASVMAILLAGIAKGIGGEEEEQVPGALSMQPGLLSTQGAPMKTEAQDLLEIIHQISLIKSSKLLTSDQQQSILKELVNQLPLKMFCQGLSQTRDIVLEVLNKEIADEKTENRKAKSTPETKDTSTKSTKEKLLCDSDGDSRGKGAKKAVVNKEKKKPRKTKRGS